MAMERKKATFTVRELADYLQIGKASAYRLVHDGTLPSVRIGRQIRIPIAAVDKWLAEAMPESA